MRRSQLILTALLIGVAGVAVASNAFASDSPNQARTDASSGRAYFAALGGLHHPPPKGLVDALASPYYVEQFAPDVSAARLVQGTLAGSEQVWLVPGKDAVCLYLRQGEGGGASCQTSDDAAAGRLILSSSQLDTPEAHVVGVLPDGVTSVDLDDASARTVRVESNVYVATTEADLASFVDGQGRSHQITIPRANK